VKKRGGEKGIRENDPYRLASPEREHVLFYGKS